MEITANAPAGEPKPYCKIGYRRIGNDCQKMVQPSNKLSSGADWFCRDGYKRVGNQCQNIFIPVNAYAKGSQWYCKTGYTRQADSCIKLTFLEK
jgi:hypothetical protein